MPNVHFMSKQDDRETPQYLFDGLNAELGLSWMFAPRPRTPSASGTSVRQRMHFNSRGKASVG